MPPILAVFGLVCLIHKLGNRRVHEQLGSYRLKNILKHMIFSVGYTQRVVLLEVMEADFLVYIFQKVSKL